jgi:hypothetical protein
VNRIAIVMALTSLLASCASRTPLDVERWTKESTPSAWDTTSAWVFVAVNPKGQIVRSVTVRFTDEPTTSCVAGEWKKLTVLKDEPQALSPSQAIPGYMLEGRALTIGLTTNICDSYDEFIGELSDLGFEGRYISQGLSYYEDRGDVYGAQSGGK